MKNGNKGTLAPEQGVLASLVAKLPELPKTVRYYDDFDDCVRSIHDFSTIDVAEITTYGEVRRVDFNSFGIELSCLLRHLFFALVVKDLRISSVVNYVISIRHVPVDTFEDLLAAGPLRIKQVWATLFARNLPFYTFVGLKALLVFLSARRLCGWSPDYLDLISAALPAPTRDKYAKVRTGDVFLSAEEEAQVVIYLENLATQCRQEPEQMPDSTLFEGGMLLCSYLFGMRPYQIAQVKVRDVRIWDSPEQDTPTVHVTFYMAKQKRQASALPMTRRIKQEWSPIIARVLEKAHSSGCSGDSRLFQVSSAREVSQAIQRLATRVTNVETSAMDLRHTAAQRLVDAGASQEEVAEFLGHSDITTGLVYFASSPNQAERVNKALAISPIYQQVVKIAHARFISPDELAGLKEEQQIAGVPHGIPITGIGGCEIGQPSCPYNPITSCYGCRKFMPVSDIELHQRVLTDMRGVVKFFVDAARGETTSPTFMQLKNTLIAIQKVIAELEEKPHA